MIVRPIKCGPVRVLCAQLAVLLCMFLFIVSIWSVGIVPAVAADDVSQPKGTLGKELTQGRDLLNDGKLDEALERFDSVLVLQPDNAEAHYHIGRIYLRKGEWDKGIDYLERSTRLAPGKARYSIDLAAAYEQRGKLDVAVAEYQRLLSTGSRDPDLKIAEKNLSLSTGKALARKGELNAALLLFNGLLLEYPNDPLVLFNIGATYVLLNRVEEAERIFKQLVGMQPKNILAHLNLANIYERQGRMPEALKHLKAITDLNVPGEITKTAKVKFHIIKGRQQFQDGKWEAALDSFRHVTEIDPNATESLFNIGLIHIRLGNPQAAELAFLKVLKLTPNDFSARLNLGGFYFDTGKVEKAIEQFKYVIEHDKDGRYRNQASLRLNVLHTVLADNALQLGNVNESLREYEKALDYFPGNVKAYFNRGLILVQQKQYAKARDAFAEVVRLDPKNLRGRLNLANVYEQLNELSKAAEQYETILQINADSREAEVARQKWKITKARGLWSEQKLTEAEAVLNEIVAEHPENTEANFYLGIILSSKGFLREAAKAYQKVVAARPSNHKVRMLLAKIFEQLELEELAATEYRTIIFESKDGGLVGEARERLRMVESRLSGFANNLGYSFSLDSNVNYNDESPARDIHSDLSFDIVYAQKIRDDLKFRLNLKPTYSTYHVGEFDYINGTINYLLKKGTPERSWSLLYGHQELSGLLNEQSVSRSSTYHLQQDVKLFLPAVFGLSPVGLSGESIPTGFSMSFSLQTIESFGAARVGSYNPSLAVTLGQGLKWGVAASAGISASARRNREQNEVIQEFAVGTNPLTGLALDKIRIKVFDSRDYEFDNVGLNLSLSKVLSPGLRAGVSGAVGYTGYINVDSSSEQDEKRKNFLISLSSQLSYQFYKNISFFGTLAIQRNYSTLGVDDLSRQSVQETVRNFQSTALGAYTRYTVTSGMSMNF